MRRRASHSRSGRRSSPCAAARAEDKVEVKAEYFTEPANKQALHVFHPAVGVNVDAHPRLLAQLRLRGRRRHRRHAAHLRRRIDAISSATHFSDTRHAFHGGAELRLGPVAVDAGYTYALRERLPLARRRRRRQGRSVGQEHHLQLGYAHNFDSVCDVDNKGAMPDRAPLARLLAGLLHEGAVGLVEEPLAIDSYAASWTQVLTPILVSDLSATFQVLDGFQSNPYRRVRLFGTVEAQESEPLLRQRVAVQARLRLAVVRARGALGVLGRFYYDTWGIKSGTAEVSWEEWLVPQLLFRVRGRFYQQGRAVFYRDAGEALSYETVGPVGQYFTGDRELSPFRDYLVGFKVAWVRNADERGKVWRCVRAARSERQGRSHRLPAADAAAAEPGARRRPGQRAHRRARPRAALVACRKWPRRPHLPRGGILGRHEPRSRCDPEQVRYHLANRRRSPLVSRTLHGISSARLRPGLCSLPHRCAASCTGDVTDVRNRGESARACRRARGG